MYNPDQKERYLKSRECQYSKIRLIDGSFFNFTEQFERSLDKDCCNFTSPEILTLYSSFCSRSWETLLNFNSQLKLYTAWCLKESLVNDHQNHYEEINQKALYCCLNIGLKNSMVISRDELEKAIRTFPNPSDKFLALALFEGLGGAEFKDFYYLLPNQFVGGKVLLPGRILIVSPLLKELAIESAEEYNKYSYDSQKRMGYRKTDPSIIKDSANVYANTMDLKVHMRKIQRRISMLQSEYGMAFSYAGLRNSGRINMLNTLMASDKYCNGPRDTFLKHRDAIEYRYGKLQRFSRWVKENEQFLIIPDKMV